MAVRVDLFVGELAVLRLLFVWATLIWGLSSRYFLNLNKVGLFSEGSDESYLI
jgi:hypothetical protein